MKHVKTLAVAGLIGLSATAWAATPSTANMTAVMQSMQARMQLIVSTPDAAERQKLAATFMQDMPGQCGAMMGTAGAGMMGGGMMQSPAGK